MKIADPTGTEESTRKADVPEGSADKSATLEVYLANLQVCLLEEEAGGDHSTRGTVRSTPRTCILTGRSLHALLCLDLSSSDITLVKLKQAGAENVYIFSA